MKLNNFLSDKRVLNAPDPASNPNPDPASGSTPADPALQQQQTPPPVAEGPDLSFIPADYLADGKPDTQKFSEHYADLVARDAQYAERMAEVPEDGVYDYTLPEDFSFGDLALPEDFKVQISDDPDIAPFLGELGGLLKEYGIPKSAGEKFAGLIARYEATKYSQMFKAQAEDLKTLGTPAQIQARKDAVSRALAARVPAELAKAIHIDHASAAQIKALEMLLAPRSPQVPPGRPNGVDTENLSAYDRLKLANAQQA